MSRTLAVLDRFPPFCVNIYSMYCFLNPRWASSNAKVLLDISPFLQFLRRLSGKSSTWISSSFEYIGVITSDQELSKTVQRLGCITRKTIEFDDTYRGIDAFAGRKGKLGSAMPDSRPLLGDRIGKSAFNDLKELKRKLEGK